MKKIIILLILLLVVVGCSSKQPSFKSIIQEELELEIITSIEQISKLCETAPISNICKIKYMAQNKKLFTDFDRDCEKLSFTNEEAFFAGSTALTYQKGCRSFLLDDRQDCNAAGFGTKSISTVEYDNCLNIFYVGNIFECHGRPNICVKDLAIEYDERYLCDWIYDKEIKKQCEEAFEIELEDTPEEQEAQDDFRDESDIDINKDTAYEGIPGDLLARCPTPFPDDAVKQGFSDSLYWQRKSTGDKVGPFMSWVYGTDRSVKKWFTCKNLEGEDHGPRIEWYKNGNIKQECELKNHKLVQCEFFCENGQIRQRSSYDENGKEHGTRYLWDCSGKSLTSQIYEHGLMKG